MIRKILYIDLDNVLVDFPSGIEQLDQATKERYEGRLDEVPNIFSLMKPMPFAIDSFNQLAEVFDTYILSTLPWENPSARELQIKLGQNQHGSKGSQTINPFTS